VGARANANDFCGSVHAWLLRWNDFRNRDENQKTNMTLKTAETAVDPSTEDASSCAELTQDIIRLEHRFKTYLVKNPGKCLVLAVVVGFFVGRIAKRL
jgi:hypothetical protein